MKGKLGHRKYSLKMMNLKNEGSSNSKSYNDTAFTQDYSVKYFLESSEAKLLKASADRNGKIQLLTSEGLNHLHQGSLLYPGKIVNDNSYRFMKDKTIVDMIVLDNQFVFLDKEVIFSNAWAGSLHSKHELSDAKIFEGNDNFNFLVSDGKNIHLIQEQTIAWKGSVDEGEIKQIINHSLDDNSFFILSNTAIFRFSSDTKQLEKIYQGNDLTAFDFDKRNDNLIIGSKHGYFVYNLKAKQQEGNLYDKLPWQEITSVKAIDEKLWFGTIKGTFVVNKNGQINYYASKRWLPD